MDFTVYQLAWNKSDFFREPLKIPDTKKEKILASWWRDMGVYVEARVMACFVEIPSRSGRMIGHTRTETRSGLIGEAAVWNIGQWAVED